MRICVLLLLILPWSRKIYYNNWGVGWGVKKGRGCACWFVHWEPVPRLVRDRPLIIDKSKSKSASILGPFWSGAAILYFWNFFRGRGVRTASRVCSIDSARAQRETQSDTQTKYRTKPNGSVRGAVYLAVLHGTARTPQSTSILHKQGKTQNEWR